MINQASRDHLSKNYNLEERTALLAEHIIDEVKSISINSINKRIIEQLIGSSGSIGANYCEAVESESKKDFVHKISIAKKEIILIFGKKRRINSRFTSLIPNISTGLTDSRVNIFSVINKNS